MRFFKPDRNFLGAILLILIVITASGNFFLARLFDQQSETLLNREVDYTALVLDAELNEIRCSGDLIANTCALTARNAKYYNNNILSNDYIEEISLYFKESALAIEGLSSIYLHLSPDICNQSNKGIGFSVDEGSLSLMPVIDLSLYNETEYDKVGWYYLPLEQKRSCWIEPNNKVGTESYVISYVVPIYLDNLVIGVFGIDVKISKLLDIVHNTLLFEDGFMYLTDRSGSAIGRIPYQYNPSKYVTVERKLFNNMTLKACVPKSSLNNIHHNFYMNLIKVFRFLIVLLVIYFIIIQIEYFINNKRLKKKKNPFSKTLFAYAAGFVFIVIFQFSFFAGNYYQSNKKQSSISVKPLNNFDRTLNVTGDIDFCPFTYMDNGLITGHNVELFTEVCNRMGYNVNFNLTKWDDAIKSVRDGQNDVILGLGNLTVEKDSDLLRSTEFFEDYFVVVGKHSISSILDVSGKRNAVIDGIDNYDVYGITKNGVRFSSYTEALQAIEDGVCDYGVMRQSEALYNIDKLKIKDIKVVYYILESYLTFGVAHDNNKLLLQINNTINDMIMDGSVKKIGYKWLSYYTTPVSLNDIAKDNIQFVIGSAFFAFTFLFMFLLTFIKTQKERMEEEGKNYKLLSEQDSLTKIRNRGNGEKLVRQCIDEKIPGTFCFFDIDKFKYINDTFGHIVGDKVLIEIAQCMMKCFRSNDILYRLGGDEFAMYLPHLSDMDVLKNKMSYLISLIDKIEIPELNGHKICISAGLVFYDSNRCMDFEEIYRRADQQAYISKKTEGSCFSIYS